MGFFDLFKRGNRASKGIQHMRLTTCSLCPSKRGELCGECGCVLKLKARLEHETCPLKKWTTIGE